MAVSKESGAAATVKKTAAKPKASPAATAAAPAEEQKPDDLSPATDVAASGALIEQEIVDRIDTAHPAVDDNPREGASVASNQIDFNDPTLTQEEAVVKNLTGGAEQDQTED